MSGYSGQFNRTINCILPSGCTVNAAFFCFWIATATNKWFDFRLCIVPKLVTLHLMFVDTAAVPVPVQVLYAWGYHL